MIIFSTTIIDLVLLSFFLIYPICIFFNPGIVGNIIYCFFVITAIVIICSKKKIHFHHLFRVFIIFLGISLFTLEGVLNGFYISSIREVIAILMLVTLPIIFILLDENNLLNIEKTRQAVVWMFYIYIALELLLMLTYFDIPLPSFLVNTLQNSYELTKHATSLDEGVGGIIPRFNLASDCYIPIIYLLYAWKRNSGVFLWFIVLIMVLLTFSRFRFLEFGFLSLLLSYKSIISRSYCYKKVINLICVLFIIALFVSQLDFDFIINVLEIRFTGGDATGSDQERMVQFYHLLNCFLDNFLFGIGIGGYLSDHIRHSSLWLYELGFLMFLMQFGLVGFVVVYLNYLHMVITSTVKKADSNMKLPMIVSFLFWALEAGIQGGIIEGINCGVLFCCIYVLAHR